MPNQKCLFVTAALILFSLLQTQQLSAQAPSLGNIQTTDYLVPHVSTLPANASKHVELFLREKVEVGRRGKAPVVLMIPGATVSAVPDFDLQFENYSWMEYLATAGFDVFAMDHTGYGLSPRPMMDDPCNTSISDQQSYLIPKRLAQTCSPPYPFQLTTIQSDWDEIDTVVEYLRRVRDVERVNLIAWSRGGARAGGYAAQHRKKWKNCFCWRLAATFHSPRAIRRLYCHSPESQCPCWGTPNSMTPGILW